jgi:hypothetical protein
MTYVYLCVENKHVMFTRTKLSTELDVLDMVCGQQTAAASTPPCAGTDDNGPDVATSSSSSSNTNKASAPSSNATENKDRNRRLHINSSSINKRSGKETNYRRSSLAATAASAVAVAGVLPDSPCAYNTRHVRHNYAE